MSNDTMNKKGLVSAVVAAASAVLYSVVMFIIFGFDKGANFWISYVFALVAIILSCTVTYLGFNKARTMTDWIFSIPIMRWCGIYSALAIILSILFALVDVSWKLVFLVQLALPVLFCVVVFPCFVQKKHMEQVAEQTAAKVSYVRLMHAKLVALLPRVEDAEVKKELDKAVDLLRHSDPMSADSLNDIEQKISSYVDEFDAQVRAAAWEQALPLIKEINMLIHERNQLSIASKMIQYR